MGFDLNRFTSAGLTLRTAEVKTPMLKDFFGEGEEAVFKVRGLTGEEWYAMRQAIADRRDTKALAEKILSGAGEAIAQAIGDIYADVPEELARRINLVVAGCVEPKLDLPAAVKLFKFYAPQAHLISEEIFRLSGEGATLGESKGCGEIPASATTST